MRKPFLVGVVLAAACGARTGLDLGVDHVDAAPLVDAGSPDSAVKEAGIVLGCTSPHVLLTQPFDGTDLTNQIDEIVAAHGEVYFHAGTGIWHISTVMGTLDLLGVYGVGQSWPVLAKLDINTNGLFWAIPGTDASTLFFAPIDGGPKSVLATIPRLSSSVLPPPDFVSVADGGVYVFYESVSGSQPVAFVTFDGGVAISSPALPATIARLLVVGGTTYVGSVSGLYASDGGSAFQLLTPIRISDLALDGDSIVFTEGAGDSNEYPLSVWRVALGGGDPVPVASQVSPLLGGIAVDNTSIYFCDRGAERGSSELVRITKLTGAVTTMAHSDGQIIDVALDDTCVYWTSAPGGNPASPGNQVFAAPK